MNKNDCEEIGLNLAALMTSSTDMDGFVDSMCSLDPRIRENFDAYSELQSEEDAVEDEVKAEMVRRHGSIWPCMKCAAAEYKELFKEIKKRNSNMAIDD